MEPEGDLPWETLIRSRIKAVYFTMDGYSNGWFRVSGPRDAGLPTFAQLPETFAIGGISRVSPPSPALTA
jgi:hypothetical protein